MMPGAWGGAEDESTVTVLLEPPVDDDPAPNEEVLVDVLLED